MKKDKIEQDRTQYNTILYNRTEKVLFESRYTKDSAR